MPEEDLQLKVQDAWDRFRSEFHKRTSVMNTDGSLKDSNGAGTSPLRSEIAKAGALVAYVTELFNGSGELLDTESLLSVCLNMGANLEGFTSTVLSLMFLVDSQYCLMNGEQGTVLRVLNAFEKGTAQPDTFQSTYLRMPSIAEHMQSQEPESRSRVGKEIKLDSSKELRPKKKRGTGNRTKKKKTAK